MKASNQPIQSLAMLSPEDNVYQQMYQDVFECYFEDKKMSITDATTQFYVSLNKIRRVCR